MKMLSIESEILKLEDRLNKLKTEKASIEFQDSKEKESKVK